MTTQFHPRVPEYSHAERDRRWSIARELMRAEGLDALLVYWAYRPQAPRVIAQGRD